MSDDGNDARQRAVEKPKEEDDEGSRRRRRSPSRSRGAHLLLHSMRRWRGPRRRVLCFMISELRCSCRLQF
jgi:hypothetical protein